MKIEITKDQFKQLIKHYIDREDRFGQLFTIGLGELVEYMLHYPLGEMTVLDLILKQIDKEEEFRDEVYEFNVRDVDYLADKYYKED